MLGPEAALAAGRWVKLICGASNQDLASIEDLAGIYALVGVHCIDVAADAAVVAAARRGLRWAAERSPHRPPEAAPWLMVSLSDGADPHFRKAWFDPRRCPVDCPRPCERVCPAQAIPPLATPSEIGQVRGVAVDLGGSGVLEERCYGCGRCLPACPQGLIIEREQVLAAASVPHLLAALRPDAIELHTRIGRAGAFGERLAQVREAGIPLRCLAVSCGLEVEGATASGGKTTAENLQAVEQRLEAELWDRFTQVRNAGFTPLWQLDGRPMSGDVGGGTARAAVGLLRRMASHLPPGPVQLAGGTNDRTLPLVEALSPSDGALVAGVAFGSVARARLMPLLLEAQRRGGRLLDQADLLPEACAIAGELVDPWLARVLPVVA